MMDSETVSVLNEQRLADRRLDPSLVAKVRRLLKLAEADGYSLLITQAYRSRREQDDLYASGRSRAGKIVTNARGGQSKHNLGKAVDLAFVISGQVVWTQLLYARIGGWAKQVGLSWGGSWPHFKDYPHVEI